ncbi:hypothetical protein KP509_23G017300 [Ceratopteris richardii]|uniref:EID1-like F-box protein 2 n=2 Tax=Ceratopteris richardii TaxID=49495 RepID=A0A8T2S0A4_CERRI|nr:hypothetical protein KP509_23G017300 [Ceratopteris richardii]KAH7301245.1 hypothetical protein KP509_23G017300 [Ceratopteris richardii]
MLDDVIPGASLSGADCSKLEVANGSGTESSLSKGSNHISSCQSCARNENSDFPALCDGPFNYSVTVSNKRRPQCTCLNLCDERILVLVAHHTNWNPFLLCFLSCVCKKTRAITNRILWRQFCLSRAPKMATELLLGAKDGRIDGGWQALGKLFLYCAGCCHSKSDSYYPVHPVAAHFVPKTRFSRTAGRSFLIPPCRVDVLYVSDPCEHANEPEDVGLFRGVFKGFDNSETKKLLTARAVQYEESEICPFCKARVWSMSRARMIPRSASMRLAAYNENVEYLICLNGHLYGRCALLHLSDSDACDEDY